MLVEVLTMIMVVVVVMMIVVIVTMPAMIAVMIVVVMRVVMMVTRTILQVTEVEEQMKCLREEKSQVLGRLSEATKEKQALERKCSQVGRFCCNLLITCIYMQDISDSINGKCVCAV